MVEVFMVKSANYVSYSDVIQGVCPGWGAKTNFTTVQHVNDIVDNRNGSDNQLFGMRLCPDNNCKAIVWFQRVGQNIDKVFIYPPSDAVFRVNDVPTIIQDDAKEALRCFGVLAYKATVVMCRRAVEATCDDKKAQGKDLKTQIDDLYAKGVISQQLKDWAHQLRYFGNSGAHPDPAFGTITKDDAAEMIRFAETFLRYVYEMPAQIAAAQVRSGKP